MLQELAARTGAAPWAIASMLFFLGVFIAITVKVVRTRPEELEERARLPLDGDALGDGLPTGEGPGSR